MADSIFLGTTVSPTREYVANVVAVAKPARLHLPCAGRFAAAEAIVRHGYPAKEILASDIGVFSSLIGYAADPQLDVRDVLAGIEVDPGFVDLLARDGAVFEPHNLGHVLVTLRYAQIRPTSQYAANLRASIRRRWGQIAGQTYEHFLSLVQTLHGLTYRFEDLRTASGRVSDDPGAALYINPPAYSKGYTKMFETETLRWSGPAPVSEFEYKAEFASLAHRLRGAAGLAIVYVQASLDRLGSKDGWHVCMANDMGKGRVDYLVSNQPVETWIAQKTKTNPPKKFPIYNDEEITPDSQLTFVKVDRDTCLYYRDLFVHKLGSTMGEVYLLMLIDGRVVTALGLNTQFIRKFQSEYIYETFGISKSSRRYKRLGKLFMLALTSGEFRRMCIREMNLSIHQPNGVQTTSITTHPEGKTDRSVMYVHDREQRQDGRWKVIYRADFREDTYQEVVRKWLTKWGTVKRGASSTSAKDSNSGGSKRKTSRSRTRTRASRTDTPSTA